LYAIEVHVILLCLKELVVYCAATYFEGKKVFAM